MKIYCLIIFLFFIKTVSADEIVPTISVVKNISFSQIIFLPGNCKLDHITGDITDISTSNICFNAGRGVVGHYVIISEPNKLINIRVNQRDKDGDGLIFIPDGRVENDVESKLYAANQQVQINSGASGVVRIFIGGRLFSTTELAPNSSVNLTKEGGIEWEVLP